LICANSIASSQTGFAVDTNQVTLISQQEVKELPLCSKEQTADLILDQLFTFHS
jgi:phosphopantothenoylcysteine decarboxylase/phosphopantothenate--cysteine ligase